ncbi:MAG TPA: hypothetical protein ENF81_09245, partial [Thermotogaceae bacterium]|nr:hypothetical protein [Thermotogaceae bacterium]
MKKKFLLKNSYEGDALITTIVVLMIMAVFLLGYLNIASKRIEAHVNFNKYVDMKTSMANAIHAALVVAINNYDSLSNVATELESLDTDENLKAVFSDIAKHYPFLNESSPTIFSDLQYSETVEASESLFKTAYGYPNVYYLKMNEKYEDVIISTIKDENGKIMNYLLGLVEKYPFFDELRKKVYIINDTSSDPNKESRFLPEEEFLGALMTQGILFFNKSRGQGNQQYDYGTLYFSVTDHSKPLEIPSDAFLEFLSDFNHTIVANGSEFLWVGPGNKSTSTMTIEE